MSLPLLPLYCPLLFLLLSLLSKIAFADVSIVAPGAGETFTARSGTVSVQLQWVDSKNQPALSDVTSYSFSLCSGPNNDITCVATLASSVDASDVAVDSDGTYSYTARFSAGVVGDGQFFIQVYAQIDGFGHTNHYTPRFELSGMSGTVSTYTYSAPAAPGAETVATKNQNTGAGGGMDISRSFTVPYTAQTGATRYAPMQLQPGTTVSATSWTRQFATSAVTWYSTLATGPLAQQTTVTAGWSYTINSDFNYATPAPFPSDNGGWYDPRERQTLTARRVNANRLIT